MFKDRTSTEKWLIATHCFFSIFAVAVTLVSGWSFIETLAGGERLTPVTALLLAMKALLFHANVFFTLAIIYFRTFSRTKLWCRIVGWEYQGR